MSSNNLPNSALQKSSLELQRSAEIALRFCKLILNLSDIEYTQMNTNHTQPLLQFASEQPLMPLFKNNPEIMAEHDNNVRRYLAFKDNLLYNLRILTGEFQGDLKVIDINDLPKKDENLATSDEGLAREIGLWVFVRLDKGQLNITLDKHYNFDIRAEYPFPQGVGKYEIGLNGKVIVHLSNGGIRDLDDTDMEALTVLFNKANEVSRRIKDSVTKT